MISLMLAKKILSLFIIMFMGVVLVKSKLVTPENSKCLSVISLYVITPCVILSAFQVDYTPDIQSGFILALIAAVLVHIVLLLVTKACGHLFHLTALERATTIYSNAGSLIIPIVSSVLGIEWVIYTTPFVAVQLSLIWSHGKMLLSGDTHIEWQKIFKNINMVFIFIGIFLFIAGIRFSPVLQEAIVSTGDMTGPLAMLVTGILIGSLDWYKVRSYHRLWLVALLRLVLLPIVIIAVFLLYSTCRHRSGRRRHPIHHASCRQHPLFVWPDADGDDLWQRSGLRQHDQRGHHIAVYRHHACCYQLV